MKSSITTIQTNHFLNFARKAPPFLLMRKKTHALKQALWRLMVLDFPKKISIVADEMKYIHKTLSHSIQTLKKSRKQKKIKKDEVWIEMKRRRPREILPSFAHSERKGEPPTSKNSSKKLQRVIGIRSWGFDISRGWHECLSKVLRVSWVILRYLKWSSLLLFLLLVKSSQ